MNARFWREGGQEGAGADVVDFFPSARVSGTKVGCLSLVFQLLCENGVARFDDYLEICLRFLLWLCTYVTSCELFFSHPNKA